MVDEVQQREVPEQLVLTEQRPIRVEELPGWLDVAMDRVAVTTATYGGMVGPQFVLFQTADPADEVCDAAFPVA